MKTTLDRIGYVMRSNNPCFNANYQVFKKPPAAHWWLVVDDAVFSGVGQEVGRALQRILDA